MWPVGTLEYLRLRVSAAVNGNQSYNPTNDAVQIGFVPKGGGNLQSTAPTNPQWYNGSWETTTITGQTAYVARVLVGPGGTFTPTAGTAYWVWIKITDNPEIPARQIAELVVT